MSTPTPGPWNVLRVGIAPRFQVTSLGATSARIAVTFGDVDEKTDQANARLIAAAPELLAAAEYFSALCDGNKVPNAHEIEMLRRAIAKATGGAA